MKKTYEAPEAEIIEIVDQDIITSSYDGSVDLPGAPLI